MITVFIISVFGQKSSVFLKFFSLLNFSKRNRKNPDPKESGIGRFFRTEPADQRTLPKSEMKIFSTQKGFHNLTEKFMETGVILLLHTVMHRFCGEKWLIFGDLPGKLFITLFIM